uniref:Dirigent protein n=1 Tax=Solanum lycopersicum TaxID=4081 RepID=A0A3Q7HMD3_SOLLC
MMAFTSMMEGGEFGDSLNFFGVHKIGRTMSKVSVTGGSGKFKMLADSWKFIHLF